MGLSARVSFFPPPPLSFFGSHPIFRVGKTLKITFLCLSLLPNLMETLATQAAVETVDPSSTWLNPFKNLAIFTVLYIYHIKNILCMGQTESGCSSVSLLTNILFLPGWILPWICFNVAWNFVGKSSCKTKVSCWPFITSFKLLWYLVTLFKQCCYR